jgi:hypothetical protein
MSIDPDSSITLFASTTVLVTSPAVGCDDWLAERSEFELRVPVLELSDDSSESAAPGITGHLTDPNIEINRADRVCSGSLPPEASSA